MSTSSKQAHYGELEAQEVIWATGIKLEASRTIGSTEMMETVPDGMGEGVETMAQ